MRRRYNTEQEQEAIAQEQDFLGDIGNFELPDIDLDLMEFLPSDETEKTRYTLPKVVPMREDFVLYDNAQKMARELRLGFSERFDAFVSGSFIFGDFIEAYLTTQNACAKRMTISTLSMSQNNVDSLHTLMEKGYIEELNLIISVYFWGNERSSLIPYIYKQLDIDDRFQLAVAGVHTKTVNFETLGGGARLSSTAPQTSAPAETSSSSPWRKTQSFMISTTSTSTGFSTSTQPYASRYATARRGITSREWYSITKSKRRTSNE